MSDIAPHWVTCPRCQAQQRATLFTSLNGEFLEAQALLLLEGTFEQQTCERCGHGFRPEHCLLYTHLAERLLVVMYPLAQRLRYAAIERDVEERLAAEFAAAPPAAQALCSLRPRLCFGQHMLSEAARVARAGLSAALLECAKLYALRAHLADLLPLGPVELCFERIAESGALVHGAHALASGERLGTLLLPPQALAQVRAEQGLLQAQYPDLFERSYVSASRYLYPASP